MDEHRLTVDRTARFYTLGSLDGSPREVWFACHGFAQLAGRFIRHLAPLSSPTRLIVAPEALNRFYFDPVFGFHGPDAKVGATWMTREDRLAEIADYVAYLDALHEMVFSRVDRAAVRLVVLGFSQGVATVVRWAALGRARPDHLVLWASTFPPELDGANAERLRSIARITVVAGDRDPETPRITSVEERSRLERLGVHAEIVRFDGGHEIHAATLMLIAES
jgi:predicted esterase